MKVVVLITGFQIIFGNVLFTNLYANGPSQPEMHGPSASSSDNLVDPFTGDFSYSIPILDIGDIPLSLNYQAGITMEQEASWVGLGWSLNPGSITRSVRGLPDDFKYEEITDEINIRPNKTYMATVGYGNEIMGFKDKKGTEKEDPLGLEANLNFIYNSYNGFYISSSFSQSAMLGKLGLAGYSINSPSPDNFGDIGVSLNLNIGEVLNKLGIVEGSSNNNNYWLNGSLSTKKGLEAISFNYVHDIEKEFKANKYDVSGYTRDISSIGFGGGYVHNMERSYSPKPEYNFKNISVSIEAKYGFAFLGVDAYLSGLASYSEQSLEDSEKEKKSKAIGYLYLENDKEDDDVLLDFNRENDGQIYPKTDYLPLGYLTYDIYHISSPGLNGSFHAHRNDIGYIQEPESKLTSNSISGGFEASFGNIISPGIDVGYMNVSSSSGNWAGNSLNNVHQYNSTGESNSLNEKVYFAMSGEPTFIDETEFMDKWGADDAITIDIENTIASVDANPEFEIEGGASGSIPESAKKRNGRVTRNTSISYLTKHVADAHGMNTKYKPCKGAKPHHISRIVVTSPDGTRYIYGLPVYNITQEETSMNVSTSLGLVAPGVTDNLVTYSTTQNSKGNGSGEDWYYHKTTTPAYVHSYLLTEILSPDYVDATGDGASPDDLGNYVLYTYGKESEDYYEPNVAEFKWRTPFTVEERKANYYEGLRSEKDDEKASFIYGTKEIWYLNKIETKRYVAEFIISEKTGDGKRHDGYQVKDSDGGMDGYPSGNLQLSKLDEIRLYSTSDYLYADKQPLKTVHFEYNYELCKGYPANSESEEGKLTLKEVYFTHGNSQKAKYNGYQFEYLDNEIVAGYDFPYHFMYNDRWGNYKEEGDLPNTEFPYVDQSDPTQVDINAAAWCLYQIKTPGGGEILVEYESDDYAYVHDLPATQLTEIEAFSSEENLETKALWSDKMYESSDVSDPGNNNYLIFELDEPVVAASQADANQKVIDKYILFDDKNPWTPGSIPQNLYFKVMTNTNDPDEPVDDNEYITGYTKIDVAAAGEEYGYAGAILDDGQYKYGYILLKEDEIKHDGGTTKVNPISKAGWQFTMLHARNNIINETPADNESLDGFVSFITKVTLIESLISLFRNPNEMMVSNDYAKVFIQGQSWVRLKNPDNKKLGGGHRVKQIKVTDNWEEMTEDDGLTATYTKRYSYTTRNGSSSGVAAYEPAVGGDENPKKRAMFFGFEPSKEYQYAYYNELPMGEEFYPASIVGYSNVTIESLPVENVNRTATGKIVYEFYTTKDYPFRTTHTPLKLIIKEPDISLTAVIPSPHYNLYAASQGYSIETNDMHGKLKKVSHFAEGGKQPYASTEYLYKDDGGTQLINTVKAIDAENDIDDYELGLTIEHSLDFRSSQTASIGGNMAFNLDIFTVGFPFPIPFFNAYAGVDMSYERVNTIVSTKVVHRTGLLSETVVTEEGSVVNQKNELWDIRTGNVLLTSTQNEFNDRYYSFSYPAYWHYEGMGFAADNEGYQFDSKTTDDRFNWTSGKVDDGDPLYDALVPGDEVLFRVWYDVNEDNIVDKGYEKVLRCIVYEGEYMATKDLYFKGMDGNDPQFGIPDADIKEVYGSIIRSGKRNLQTASMGSFVSREIPVNEGFSHLQVGTSKKIISASASEYADGWNMLCQQEGTPNADELCLCVPEITIPAMEFSNFLQNIMKSETFYADGTIDIHDYPIDEDELYYYEFTPGLNYLTKGEGDETNLVSNDITIDGVEDELDITTTFVNDVPANGCSFTLHFEDVDWTEVSEDVFDTPDEPVISMDIDEENIGPDCDHVYRFEVTISYTDALGELQSITGISSGFDCFPLRNCHTIESPKHNCPGAVTETANPYAKGLLGIWNKKMDYAYVDKRNKSSYSNINSINLKTDGYYNTFNEFWEYDGGWVKNDDVNDWQWGSKLTRYDASIGGIESVNQLEIISSFNYGLNNTAAEMVCDNSSYKHMGFESFEDNDYILNVLEKECDLEHFNFSTDEVDASLTTRWAHTGNYSLLLPDDESISYSVDDISTNAEPRTEYPETFTISESDCLPVFSPDKLADEKQFQITYWVKETDYLNDEVDDVGSNLELSISLDEPGPDPVLDLLDDGSYKMTNAIDGWRRHECTFTAPENVEGKFTITFSNIAEEAYSIYLDDIRVHPFDASASCFVYDHRTQRLMAELDANHYATFYEYDEDGQLTRVKKETERGIMTIQEARYNLVKKDF